MEALKQKIYIPSNHQVRFELKVPDSILTGETEVLLVFQHIPKITNNERKLGLYKGKISVAKDFDAALPDSFWIGDDK